MASPWMAQKRERTKANFNPNNVENSSGYQAANHNPDEAPAAAAGAGPDEYGFDPEDYQD
jgi:hypothetical protein